MRISVLEWDLHNQLLLLQGHGSLSESKSSRVTWMALEHSTTALYRMRSLWISWLLSTTPRNLVDLESKF